jgi:ComEC/Rec2-related protein
MGVAWLVTTAAHSFFPYLVLPVVWLALALGLVTGLVLFTRTHPNIRLFALCLLAAVLGVWRFQLAVPSLPPNLVPLDPEHMAWTGGASPLPPVLARPLAAARASVGERARQVFSKDEAALVTGLLYGERSLSQARKEDFRRAGLVHIVAVSGSNVTIIVVLCMRFFGSFGWKRRTTFAALTVGLFLYVGFVGFSAPVLRAAVMGWLVELAPITGRLVRVSRLLLIAAFAFTFWHPWALLYDPSFALSFLAMWGLLTWSSWLDVRLVKFPEILRGAISSTVGATLMTTPYSAWAFGQLSLLGLLANPLVLPLVPWAMGTGALALLAPDMAWLALPAKGFIQLIFWFAGLTRVLPWGAWSNVVIGWEAMLGWYVFLWVAWRLVVRHFVADRFTAVDRSSSTHPSVNVG